MKSNRILDAVGGINEEAVRDAKAYKKTKQKSWVKWGAMAACLCLVVAGGIFYRHQNPADFQTLVTQGAVNSTANMTWVTIDDRTAVYQQMNVSEDKLESFAGTLFLEMESIQWYCPDGSSNLKYLIRKDKSGELTLWAFSSFEVEDGETYTYGDVLRIIYSVEGAGDIVSITTTASKGNNTDAGRAIQKEVGTHTYSDPADISAFYSIVKDIICFGADRDNPADNTRFIYSFSTGESDKLTSGESTYGTRCLSIEFADGTTLDSWKYTALSGSFYEYGGIFTEPLSEEDVYILNDIFGIK